MPGAYWPSALRQPHTILSAGGRSGGGSVLEAAQHDRRVVPAEAERVRDGRPDVGAAGLVRDVVEVTGRVGLFEVDRRREHAVADREQREDRLDGAGRAEA